MFTHHICFWLLYSPAEIHNTGGHIVVIRTNDGPKKQVYPHVYTLDLVLIFTFPRNNINNEDGGEKGERVTKV